MIRLRIPLLLSLLLFPLAAQEERKIAFRTLCLGISEGVDRVVFPGRDEGSVIEIPLYTEISPVIEATFTGDKAEFFVEDRDESAEAPGQRLVAGGKLAGTERQLFVFVPIGPEISQQARYQVICYDDGEQSFSMGHIRAINLAPGPVRFVLAGRTTPEIAPTKAAQFAHVDDVNEYGMYPVVVEFRNDAGEWIKGQSVSWKATDRRREVVVTMVDPRFKQPAVRMYSDLPPWIEVSAPVEP